MASQSSAPDAKEGRGRMNGLKAIPILACTWKERFGFRSRKKTLRYNLADQLDPFISDGITDHLLNHIHHPIKIKTTKMQHNIDTTVLVCLYK